MTPSEGGIPGERLMILQMVQDGTISPDEGGRLLETVDRIERAKPAPEPPAPPKPAANVHIQITNANGDRELDLHLPIALVEMGLKLASKVAGDKIAEIPNIRSIAASGFTGTLLDINQGSDRIVISLDADERK